jgi:3'(2'), 5'-bisphosphate nucleotidase
MEFYTEKNFIDSLIILIKKCNEGILEIYKTDFEKKYKDDNSPLTLADKQTNELICNYLIELNKKLKMDILIISEEIKNKSYDERKKYEWCWVIDPLDGTKEFIKKNDQFTVNIGLIQNGIPIFGIVSIPVSGDIYYGAKNLGSFKIENSHIAELKINPNIHSPIKILVSNSHLNTETENYLKQFEKYDQLNIGSSIKLLWIAENKADIYPRLAPTSEWDTCASHAVVKYAGGKVLQYGTEDELIYNKENILNPYFIASK